MIRYKNFDQTEWSISDKPVKADQIELRFNLDIFENDQVLYNGQEWTIVIDHTKAQWCLVNKDRKKIYDFDKNKICLFY